MSRSIIEQAVRQRASDIHFDALEKQVRIRYRIDGVLAEKMLYDISLLPAIVTRIKILGGMDISEKRKPQDGRITLVVDRVEYDIRVSILPSSYGEKIVMRLASSTALTRTKAELGMQEWELARFEHILSNPNGIILVTGPTGSGKSTTMAAMINHMNQNRAINILTIEDPIEFLHTHAKATVRQREVGTDTHSFARALRQALRHDPDVIMVGEMRDPESISIALTAAETGHLVISTLHTQTAPLSISRIVDSYPADQKQQVRQQLSGALRAVISQQLLEDTAGKRVAAIEYMVDTPAIRSMIRDGKEHQLYSALQTGREFGMQTMDQSLGSLVE